MPDVFLRDLYSQFIQHPESVSLDSLFSMFLALTVSPNLVDESGNAALDTVLVAAIRGSEAAQGVAGRVIDHFGESATEEVQTYIPAWVYNAAATGSLFARFELQRTGPDMIPDCLGHFHDSGGYARYYMIPRRANKDAIGRPFSESGFSLLHWVAAYGSLSQLEELLARSAVININALTDNDETSVYLACARGSWELTSALVKAGADCSIECTEFMIGCLHWLFAFNEDEQPSVCVCLITAGAKMDAMVAEIVPFPHYPFTLPPGTPLHWAVAVASESAIEILIKYGADVLLRDGSDHYLFDKRVRILGVVKGPNMKPSALPHTRVLGLSALDYAAMNHDPYIFDLLIREGKDVHVNSVDEEGWSILHRLSANSIRQTRTGNDFSHIVFQGRPEDTERRLMRTVVTILKLGANLELLSAPSQPRDEMGEHNSLSHFFPSRTPLMMAALGSSPEVVKALLAAGANVNTENEKGKIALLYVSTDKKAADRIMRDLIFYGSDVNHQCHEGTKPIIVAAMSRLFGVVDLLLSRGADAGAIYHNVNGDLTHQDCSMFGFLASEDRPFDDKSDVAVLQLLEKHVFSHADRAERKRIVESKDMNGRTLLHWFAICSMVRCVQALLLHEAPVNALRYRFAGEGGDHQYIRSWYETPLDTALSVKRSKLKEMYGGSRFTLRENEDLLERIEKVIAILTEAGGITKANEIERKLRKR